jgi:hypothetical protein
MTTHTPDLSAIHPRPCAAACVCVAAGAYVQATLPETKGRTLAEVQALLATTSGGGGGGGRSGTEGEILIPKPRTLNSKLLVLNP